LLRVAETAEQERDKWQGRIETIRTERDNLLSKMKQVEEALAQERESTKKQLASIKKEAKTEPQPDRPAPSDKSEAPTPKPSPTFSEDDDLSVVDEEYWASVLRDKASLEVQVEEGAVSEAWASSTMFRGIELILKGRDPREAWAMTQRICGV